MLAPHPSITEITQVSNDYAYINESSKIDIAELLINGWVILAIEVTPETRYRSAESIVTLGKLKQHQGKSL